MNSLIFITAKKSKCLLSSLNDWWHGVLHINNHEERLSCKYLKYILIWNLQHAIRYQRNQNPIYQLQNNKKWKSTTFIYYVTDMSVRILNEWYKTEANYENSMNLPSDWEIKRIKMTKWNKKMKKTIKANKITDRKCQIIIIFTIQRIGNIFITSRRHDIL